MSVEDTVEQVNAMVADAEARLPWTGQHPVGKVRWVHIDQVTANDYNPNSVATEEMRLLYTSIKEDGYTQPVVAIEDEHQPGHYVIVDGFHRYTTMKRYASLYETTQGYLPLVVIDKPIADRIASTVRHNRARGKHSVGGMGNLVFQMLAAGEDDVSICNKLGVDGEELARLKHITGYSKLYEGVPAYTQVVVVGSQMRAKKEYRAENPEEEVPMW